MLFRVTLLLSTAPLWQTRCWSTAICEFCLRAVLTQVQRFLRSSGANLTVAHITMMSMCGMFLMDVAKKADDEFQTSSHHTVRDAEKDRGEKGE